MIELGKLITTGDIDPTALRRINRALSIVKGTVPLDRNLGVDLDSIDNVQDAVGGLLMVEYCRCMLQYFPDYEITDISFEVDGGKVTPTVVIGYA
jgi:hypothetical protein